MEKLNEKKIFNVIFLLTFLGIVLSFSLFFYMSETMYSEEEENGEFFGLTYGVSDDDLFEYDSRFMKNSVVHDAIIETEYKMFGNVKHESIVKGKHEFLFEFGKNQYGYDYAADYFGQRKLTASELEALGDAIALRQKIYADQGRYYVLAVIPNSQTVYSEYMPQYLVGRGNNTVLSQLSRYMKEQEIGCYIDLTEFIKASKGDVVMYNNTENSVNALGAYYVYSAIIDSLPEDVVSADRKLDVNDFSYFIHYTDGKNTAIEAGLESLIKNETVSMSNSTEFKYTVVDHSEGVDTTYVKSAYKNEVSVKPSILLDCSNEWDKIQLMPYFSNTFGVSSYKIGHSYDPDVMYGINPLVVIQTIHEYEIPMLLDRAVSVSYQNALGQDVTPYKTKMPADVEYTVLDSNSVCISGIIENDAEVRVFGEGFSPVSVKSIGGRFFVRISFEDSVQNKEVFLDAKSDDKAASDHMSLVISGTNNVGSARDVAIGTNSMLYRSDYQVPFELPTKEELDEYRIRMFSSFSIIKETCGNFDLEMIYASVPQKLSVYIDGMPETLVGQKNRLDEIKYTFSEILERASVKFLDLSDLLSAHAESEKMFFQTDERITDIAYYYMYCEILNSMRNSTDKYDGYFKPVKAEQFLEYSYPVSTGMLASSLGFDMNRVTERVTRLKFTNGKTQINVGNGAFAYYGTNEDMPCAIIVYDNDCEPLITLLAEHFRYTYVMKKNETAIPESLLSSVSPDFIIYLCDESKIDFTLDY